MNGDAFEDRDIGTYPYIIFQDYLGFRTGGLHRHRHGACCKAMIVVNEPATRGDKAVRSDSNSFANIELAMGADENIVPENERGTRLPVSVELELGAALKVAPGTQRDLMRPVDMNSRQPCAGAAVQTQSPPAQCARNSYEIAAED